MNHLCKFRSNEDDRNKKQPHVYISALHVQGIDASLIAYDDPKHPGAWLYGATIWCGNSSFEVQETVEQAYKIFEAALTPPAKPATRT